MQAKSLSTGGVGHASICDMAACYIEAIRKVQPEGPYRLLGWSFGGVVVQEMAAQLEAHGANIATVLLLDSILSGDDFTTAEPVDDAELLLQQAETMGIKPDGLSMDALKEALAQEGKRTGLFPPEAEIVDLDAILSAMQQAPALMASWSGCPQLNAAVTFVRASDNERTDLMERLTQLTRGDVQIVSVPSPHSKMCDTANSTDVARIVNMALRLKQ